MKVCTKCIYDDRVNGIIFDDQGVCNYCHQIEKLTNDYGTGTHRGKSKLDGIVENIKKAGKSKKYDCIIGVSGGTDSSYMMYWAKQQGLKPLAVHYDNTWNTAIATENVRKVTEALDIDLFTYVVNNEESDDIFKAFFEAGVAEIEASTDLALAEVMYRVASKYKLQYVLEGHSFINEGITPVGRNYFDGKYIKSIHKEFGTKKLKTYPLMTFYRFLYWTLFKRIKKIRPYWYLDISKTEMQNFLSREFDWKYYGGHHLENRMTAFFHSYYLPNKFNSDMRNNTLAAQVRKGEKSREDAIEEYSSPPYLEEGLVEYFKERLGYSESEFNDIMKGEPKSWYEYPTYKKRFEKLKPLFKILADKELVPMSFYLKYCFPHSINK